MTLPGVERGIMLRNWEEWDEARFEDISLTKGEKVWVYVERYPGETFMTVKGVRMNSLDVRILSPLELLAECAED